MDEERLLLKPQEVQKALGIKRTKFYEMVKAGELPVIRLGKCIRVPAKALEKWIEGQEGGTL